MLSTVKISINISLCLSLRYWIWQKGVFLKRIILMTKNGLKYLKGTYFDEN